VGQIKPPNCISTASFLQTRQSFLQTRQIPKNQMTWLNRRLYLQWSCFLSTDQKLEGRCLVSTMHACRCLVSTMHACRYTQSTQCMPAGTQSAQCMPAGTQSVHAMHACRFSVNKISGWFFGKTAGIGLGLSKNVCILSGLNC